MPNLTYEQLLEFLLYIKEHDPDKLSDTVTIYCADNEEYYPAVIKQNMYDGVLDAGHIYLSSEDSEL